MKYHLNAAIVCEIKGKGSYQILQNVVMDRADSRDNPFGSEM